MDPDDSLQICDYLGISSGGLRRPR